MEFTKKWLEEYLELGLIEGDDLTMGTVFILILAFLSLKFSKWLSIDVTKDFVKKETTGIIDMYIKERDGDAFWYYVNFIDKDTGKAIRAQSNYFKVTSKQLDAGEEVKIIYYYNKGGWPYVEIIDDTLEPIGSLIGLSMFFKVVSIILFIIAGYLILSRFIYVR